MFEVYIHVPFCLRRCGYCDFNTYTAVDLGGGASRGNYAAMTIREMRLVRDWQERHGIAEPPASTDRKSTRLNSSHRLTSRMPSSA